MSQQRFNNYIAVIESKDVEKAKSMWDNAFIQMKTNDDYGSTVLHQAVKDNLKELITFFIEKTLEVDVRNNKGSTALHLAAQYGYHEVVTILLQHGADINLLNALQQTPLTLAENFNHLECVSILKKRSIIESDDVDEFKKVFGNKGLKFTKEIVSWISKLKPDKIIKYLCSRPITDEEIAAPEVWQHEEVFHEINLYRGITLTHCKMYEDSVSIKLINADALLNGPKCALQLAVDIKSHIMLNEIIKLIEDINIINIILETYQDRSNPMLDILHNRKGALEAFYKRGYTRLDIAVMDCSKMMLQYLLEKETNKRIISQAIALAMIKDCPQCVRRLRQKNAEFNYINISQLRLAVRVYKEIYINKMEMLNTIKFLMQTGETLEQDKPDTKSILQEALNYEDEVLLVQLLDSEETITVLTDEEFKFIIECQFDWFLRHLSNKLHKEVAYKLLTQDIIMDLFQKGRYAILMCFFQHLNSEVKVLSVNEYLYVAYKQGNRDFFVNLCKLNNIKPKLLENGESIMTFIINDNSKTFYSYLLESTYAQELVNMSNYAKELPLHLIAKNKWYSMYYSTVKVTDNVDQENEEGDTPIAILIKQLGNNMDDNEYDSEILEFIKALISEGNSNIYRDSEVSHRSPISYNEKYRLTIEEYYKKYGKVQQECSAGAISIDDKVTDTSDKKEN